MCSSGPFQPPDLGKERGVGGRGGVFLAFYFKKLGKKKENPVAFPWNALRCCTVCGWGPGTASVPTTWCGGGGCDPAPILHRCPSVSRAQSWTGRGGCFSPTPLIADCSLLFSSCMVRNEGLLCLQLQWHKGVPSPPNTPVHPELWGTPTPLRSCVCDAHPHSIASILLPPSPTFPAPVPRRGGGNTGTSPLTPTRLFLPAQSEQGCLEPIFSRQHEASPVPSSGFQWDTRSSVSPRVTLHHPTHSCRRQDAAGGH